MKWDRVLRVAGATAMVGIAATLAACSSDEGVAPADTIAGQFIRGTTEPAHNPDLEKFKPIAYCPRVTIRPGTQTHLVTAGSSKSGEPDIRFQGTMTQTARECDTGTGNLVMRVGVSGRVLSGPKGGSGHVSLPVRIVAVIPKTDSSEQEILYSKLHKVDVTLPEGQGSVPWAFIDNDINIKLDKRIKVYVGFDSTTSSK